MAEKNLKVKITCSRGIVDKFSVNKPEGFDFEYVNYPCSDEELAEQCKDADILWVNPVDFIRRGVVEKLDNCKLIQSLGVGFDKIDSEVAKEKGIYVCNNKGVNAVSVAELAVGHIINMLRRINEASNEIINNGLEGFYKSFNDYADRGQNELGSRKVGLIGLGCIGHEVAKMLEPFGCEIMYCDLIRFEDFEKEYNLTYASYEEILKECDIISYHVPVTDLTRNMVRKETIDMMKPNVFIVNVARGEIVNNEDLAEALNSGRLTCAVDVIAPEPPTEDHPLLNLNEVGKSRFTVTPHIAGTTNEAFTRMTIWSYDNMKRVKNGKRPKNIVNGL